MAGEQVVRALDEQRERAGRGASMHDDGLPSGQQEEELRTVCTS